MRLLLITDNFEKGGKERRLLELLKYIDTRSDIEADLVILKNKIEYQALHSLTRVKLIVFGRRLKKDPTVYFKLWRLCSGKKYQLIHSWGSMPSMYVFSISFLKRIPLINGMITNAYCKKFTKNWFRATVTFPFSNVILANSQAGLNAYPKFTSKSHVIYNGVFFERFENLSSIEVVKRELNIDTKYIVGMVGAFHPRKDYTTFILAAKNILEKRKDVTFITIGGGDNIDDCKKMVSGISGNLIKFLGKCEDVENIIQLFDIGVLLTNTNVHQEGISNAIIEYMALEKPVIATNGGGTNEIIENGVNGYTVVPFDVNDTVDKIESLLNNESLRNEFGKRARIKIEKNFNIGLMIQSFMKVYDNVLK